MLDLLGNLTDCLIKTIILYFIIILHHRPECERLLPSALNYYQLKLLIQLIYTTVSWTDKAGSSSWLSMIYCMLLWSPRGSGFALGLV